MDPTTAVFMTFGGILILAGWVQLLITSFDEDFTWGLATLFALPLSYVYSFFALKKVQGAMTLSMIGWALVLISQI